MKVKKFILSVLVVAVSFYITSFAQLTSAEVKSMSKNADLIITGKVAGQNSHWNQDKTRIFTTATIQVEDNIKGSGQNSVEVSYPGGEIGEVGELYSHSARFGNNEEVLVFLKKGKNNSGYTVLNGEAGKFTLLKDQATGEKILSQNLKLTTFTNQIKSFLNE